MNNLKAFGFLMAVLSTIAGSLCVYAVFFKDLKSPIPAIFLVGGLLFLIGATIIVLLVAVLDYLPTKQIKIP